MMNYFIHVKFRDSIHVKTFSCSHLMISKYNTRLENKTTCSCKTMFINYVSNKYEWLNRLLYTLTPNTSVALGDWGLTPCSPLGVVGEEGEGEDL